MARYIIDSYSPRNAEIPLEGRSTNVNSRGSSFTESTGSGPTRTESTRNPQPQVVATPDPETPTTTTNVTSQVERGERIENGTTDVSRNEVTREEPSNFPSTDNLSSQTSDTDADPDAFHYESSAKNWLEEFWNGLIGKSKREYEEQYNNWLAQREDNSLDRTVDAYERLGLNKAALAGSGLTASGLSIPDYGDGGASAIGTALSVTSGVAGLAGSAMDLLKGRENVISQRIDNTLKSAGVPEARFTKAMNEVAFSGKQGMIGSLGESKFQQYAQDLKNKADASTNESMKLANDFLSEQLEALGFSDFFTVNEDGDKVFTDGAYEMASASNSFVTNHEDFNFRKRTHASELNDLDAKYAFAKMERVWAKTNQEFREKYGEEQFKSLQKSNAVYDAIQEMNVPDGIKAILMLLAQNSSSIIGKL